MRQHERETDCASARARWRIHCCGATVLFRPDVLSLEAVPLPVPRARDAPVVAATSTVLPPHRYAQRDLARLAQEYLPGRRLREGRIERFFDRVGVDARYLALPAERYRDLHGLRERNDAWLEAATELGERAVRTLL